MAQRRTKQRFETLTHAALEGSVQDVRALIAAGVHRDEADDPTPLMAAAARGRLDVVEALVAAGAGVNAQAEDQSGELDQFPFLGDLFADARLTALTPLAYAVLYGQDGVYNYLAPKTDARWRREADALRRARAEYPDLAVRPYLAPGKPTSARQAERDELLASSAAARKWVVQCPLCQKQGYKPTMPEEIDRRGTADRVRRLFGPLVLENYLCQACRDKAATARQKMEAERQKPARVKARRRRPRSGGGSGRRKWTRASPATTAPESPGPTVPGGAGGSYSM